MHSLRHPQPGENYFSLFRNVHTGRGAHPAFYAVDTSGLFPGGTAAGAQSWQLTSI
jgi:hypothetical protein